ncbi:hypothetical protein FACS1894208_06950 [Clostridia bacterium]|nr:hypothetical protein FACS1894208_06950 [Clostridia bacterium]
MKNRKHVFPLVGSFLAGVTILAIILYVNSHSFSTEKWIKSPEKRDQIIDSFLSTYDVAGMEQKEIIDLLGESEIEVPFKSEDNMVYYIGDDGFLGIFAIDSRWLVITLSNYGVAIEVEIKTD